VIIIIVIGLLIHANLVKGGFDQKYQVRYNKEKERLQKDGYEVKTMSSDDILKISKKLGSKSASVTVKLPDKWPLVAPEILLATGISINVSNYTAQKSIIDLINPYFSDMKNYQDTEKAVEKTTEGTYSVLVYCHPDKLSVQDEKCHFNMPQIKKALQEAGINESKVIIQTLDIATIGKPPYKVSSPDILVDGFSDEFIQQHKEKFDMVWLPDCDGPWWDIQKTKNMNEFIKLVNKLTTIVKPGGQLICWKIVYFDVSKVVEALQKEQKYQNVNMKILEGQPTAPAYVMFDISKEESPNKGALPFLIIKK
jgi:hypothetical protein